MVKRKKAVKSVVRHIFLKKKLLTNIGETMSKEMIQALELFRYAMIIHVLGLVLMLTIIL